LNLNNMDEEQYNCKHTWKMKFIEGTAQEGISACHKCNLLLTNSNRLQLEMNRHNLGLQKKLQILTFVISIMALLISIVSIFKERIINFW